MNHPGYAYFGGSWTNNGEEARQDDERRPYHGDTYERIPAQQWPQGNGQGYGARDDDGYGGQDWSYGGYGGGYGHAPPAAPPTGGAYLGAPGMTGSYAGPASIGNPMPPQFGTFPAPSFEEQPQAMHAIHGTPAQGSFTGSTQPPTTTKGGKKMGKKPYEPPSKRKRAAKAKANNGAHHHSQASRSLSPSPSRAVPSAASGGVPSPAPSYLTCASQDPTALPAPRKILVVIDLNGTLLYRPEPRSRPRYFVPRPHAQEFLTYCLRTFAVLIWSSARPRNVVSMCESIIPRDHSDAVVAVWSRDHFGLSPADYNAKVQCYKRLTTVWGSAIVQASHPDADAGGRWDQSNTVLVDDSIEKARAEPYNLIEIPEFTEVAKGDTMLPQVHDYLNRLCFQADVSRFMRVNPFKAEEEWVPRYDVGP